MSAQPFSRHDRNLCRRGNSPRCFAGRPAGSEFVYVTTEVDVTAGSITVESMTRAEYRRRFAEERAGA